MSAEDDQLARIREAIKLQGISQKTLADKMLLPQSAISNLLNGKRRLKVEELARLEQLLNIVGPAGPSLVPIPLIGEKDLSRIEEAVRETDNVLQGSFKGVDSNAFAVAMHEARLQVARFRDFYAVIDPDHHALMNNASYLLVEDGRFRLVTYLEDPARFVSLWDPEWDGGPQLLGRRPFEVVGAAYQFGWHDNFSEKRIDMLIRKSD